MAWTLRMPINKVSFTPLKTQTVKLGNVVNFFYGTNCSLKTQTVKLGNVGCIGDLYLEKASEGARAKVQISQIDQKIKEFQLPFEKEGSVRWISNFKHTFHLLLDDGSLLTAHYDCGHLKKMDKIIPALF